jgi:6-pyruvoyl-tetrahydropterin synthase
MTKTLTWVDATISAAHYPADGGPLHGHTWRVRAYWEWTSGDALVLQRLLREACEPFDHNLLPAALSRAEELAKHLRAALSCARVDVWRDAEGLGATCEI